MKCVNIFGGFESHNKWHRIKKSIFILLFHNNRACVCARARALGKTSIYLKKKPLKLCSVLSPRLDHIHFLSVALYVCVCVGIELCRPLPLSLSLRQMYDVYLYTQDLFALRFTHSHSRSLSRQLPIKLMCHNSCHCESSVLSCDCVLLFFSSSFLVVVQLWFHIGSCTLVS